MRRPLPLQSSETDSTPRLSRFRWMLFCLLAMGCQSGRPSGPARVVTRVPPRPSGFPGRHDRGGAQRDRCRGAVRSRDDAPGGLALSEWRAKLDARMDRMRRIAGLFHGIADLAGGWVALGDDPWLSEDGNSWQKYPIPSVLPYRLRDMLNLVGQGRCC